MPASLKLSRPIRAHGEEISVLEFRDPTARDMRGMRLIDTNITYGDLIPLLASLAGVPPSSIEEMHPGDLQSAVGAVLPLLVASPETGTLS